MTQHKPALGERTEKAIDFERIVLFSDAVFAIAITLLALEVRVPEVDADVFPQALLGLLPRIGVYALSFLIVGLYWVSHHRIFRYIVRYDDTLIWLNLFFLLCVAFLPVASSVVGSYNHSLAILFYCSVLCLTSFMNMLLWWYASDNHRLTTHDIEPIVLRRVFYRSAATIGVSLLATGIALINSVAALIVLGSYAILAASSGGFAATVSSYRGIE
jgi:uncharacterized membrane protein